MYSVQSYSSINMEFHTNDWISLAYSSIRGSYGLLLSSSILPVTWPRSDQWYGIGKYASPAGHRTIVFSAVHQDFWSPAACPFLGRDAKCPCWLGSDLSAQWFNSDGIWIKRFFGDGTVLFFAIRLWERVTVTSLLFHIPQLYHCANIYSDYIE